MGGGHRRSRATERKDAVKKVAEQQHCLNSAMSINLGNSGGALCLFIEVLRLAPALLVGMVIGNHPTSR
jgi:hypothetical protein